MPTPRPRLPHLRVIGSKNAAKCPIDPALEIKEGIDNGLEPPAGARMLSKGETAIWNTMIRKAPWLTAFDIYAAHNYVILQARYLRDPKSFSATEIGHLRSLRSELGFDPSSRTKMRVPANAKTKAAKYFDNE